MKRKTKKNIGFPGKEEISALLRLQYVEVDKNLGLTKQRCCYTETYVLYVCFSVGYYRRILFALWVGERTKRAGCHFPFWLWQSDTLWSKALMASALRITYSVFFSTLLSASEASKTRFTFLLLILLQMGTSDPNPLLRSTIWLKRFSWKLQREIQSKEIAESC